MQHAVFGCLFLYAHPVGFWPDLFSMAGEGIVAGSVCGKFVGT